VASAAEHECNDDNCTPRYVLWTSHDNANHSTTGNKTRVARVVADKLLQRDKFVDRDIGLIYNEKEGYICEFETTSSNLQADVDISTCWKQACAWIPTNISRLHNIKSMAMKWA
jgi:hypothetical protein